MFSIAGGRRNIFRNLGVKHESIGKVGRNAEMNHVSMSFIDEIFFITNTFQQRPTMAENAISERLNFKILWKGMPPDPRTWVVPFATPLRPLQHL